MGGNRVGDFERLFEGAGFFLVVEQLTLKQTAKAS